MNIEQNIKLIRPIIVRIIKYKVSEKNPNPKVVTIEPRIILL